MQTLTSQFQVKKLNVSGPTPAERSMPSVATLNNYIYVFGGVKDDFKTSVDTFYDDLNRFNIKENTWENISTRGASPKPRAFSTLIADANNNRILLFGGVHYGKSFSNLVTFDDLWAYSPDQNTWTQIQPANEGPQGRGGASVWLDNNLMYVFGGVKDFTHMLNDLWVYDLQNNTWTQLGEDNSINAPTGRYTCYNDTKAWNGKLYLYGGEGIGKKGFSITNDTWQYDIKTKTWTDITPSPENNVTPARVQGSMAIIDNSLLLQGGDIKERSVKGCGSPFPENANDELWQFNLATKVWSPLTADGVILPKHKRAGSTVVDKKMYILFGYDFQCNNENDLGQVWNKDIYVLDFKNLK
ncbi:MAG: hypothetical protein H0W64_02695 [Gammaproteobacteria bacterium]|nr:hypothetical protein [Gammaproteobacteria bacterium]